MRNDKVNINIKTDVIPVDKYAVIISESLLNLFVYGKSGSNIISEQIQLSSEWKAMGLNIISEQIYLLSE